MAVLWMPARLCLAVWVWEQGCAGALGCSWGGGRRGLGVLRGAPEVARSHLNRVSKAVGGSQCKSACDLQTVFAGDCAPLA